MNKKQQKEWILQHWNFLKPKQRAEALKRYWGVSEKKEDRQKIINEANKIFGN